MYTNYCASLLRDIFPEGLDFKRDETPINPYRKEAIDRAYNESRNPSECKRLIKLYVRLTPSGIKEEPYAMAALDRKKRECKK